ncbi:MAG: N-(5'-phosphoribosyl)anthranilate isomerase [Clostridiales bacterium GWF2_38_85]|nr:MAG: N-(5'-phosphoribosyl)anthranilate isomerase [Clostridiales bacterium GWF2_38_85]
MARIKICGIKSFKEIEYVNETKPDYIGFVFAKSRRYVDFNMAYLLKAELNPYIKAVGVFVNEDIDFIKKLCDLHVIDVVQLHGDENDAYIDALKNVISKPIIKAIRVKEKIDTIYNKISYPLFDTYNKEKYGGTGESFDWNMIRIREYKKPFFLAGGLHIGNIADAINLIHPYCVDVSSGVEINGAKDGQKITDIVNLVRSIN